MKGSLKIVILIAYQYSVTIAGKASLDMSTGTLKSIYKQAQIDLP